MNNFDRDKERALSGVDLSRKGSIDEKIHALVALLNTSTDFFTTSSCSGRIIIFDDSVSIRVHVGYRTCTMYAQLMPSRTFCLLKNSVATLLL